MTRITELPELIGLDQDDVIHVVDVSDTTDSAAGTSKRISADKFGDHAGNVLKFGADGTGATDSTAAIQAAIDSVHPVYFPARDYLISEPLLIDRPKNLLFDGPGINNTSGTSPTTWETGSHARLIATENIHFFDLRAANINIHGGTFDASNIADHDKAIFHYNMAPADTVHNSKIWGGSLFDFMVLGSYDAVIQPNKGTTAIYVQWDEDPTTGFPSSGYASYLTALQVRGRCEMVRYGFHADYFKNETAQFSNNCMIHLECDGAKRSFFIKSTSTSRWSGVTQARNMIPIEETPASVIVCETGLNHWDVLAYDLNGGESNGLYRFSQFMQNNGSRNSVAIQSSNAYRDVEGQVTTMREAVIAPIGYLPHTSTKVLSPESGLFEGGVGNSLLNMTLKGATVTLKAYQGFAGSPSSPYSPNSPINSPTSPLYDLTDITTDSDTAGINPSNEFTITNAENLNLYEASTVPGFTSNEVSRARQDYVELVFDYSYRASRIWVAVSSNQFYEKVQLIRLSSASPEVVLDNVTIDGPVINDEHPISAFIFDDLSGSVAQRTIIRFIASRGTKSTGIWEIATLDSSIGGPLVTTQGNKEIYGPLEMLGDSGIRDRNATTTELEDVGDDINTAAYKKAGFCVYNSDTGRPVWASGDAAADVWNNADGTTAHTPT